MERDDISNQKEHNAPARTQAPTLAALAQKASTARTAVIALDSLDVTPCRTACESHKRMSEAYCMKKEQEKEREEKRRGSQVPTVVV